MMGELPKKLEFESIYLGGVKPSGIGKLKIAGLGLGWKETSTGQIITLQSADVKGATWLRAARGYQVVISKSDGKSVKFDGFRKDDYEQLKDALSTWYKIPLKTKDLSIRGWNWGRTDFEGSNLNFIVGSKPVFELPLDQVASTSLASKNEVSLEFSNPPAEERRRDDSLVEIRFYVPGMATRDQLPEDDLGSDEESGELSTKPVLKDGEAITAAALLHQTIKDRGDVGVITSEAIVAFPDVLSLSPRGRFELELHDGFFRLRGKSHDYKILYSSITKMFLLPKLDDLFWMFVVGLEPPLRQGQTRYPYLMFQFAREEEIDVDINLVDEELKTHGLEKSYEGPGYEVVTDIFKVLAGKSVGTSSYLSSQSQPGIRCSQKANEGTLYPLGNAVLAIPKPAVLLLHNHINTVTFSRVGGVMGTTRTFEIKFTLDNGTDHVFSSIAREEYNGLVEYCQSKRLVVENEMENEGGRVYADDVSDDSGDNRSGGGLRIGDIDGESGSSPDEDFVGEESSSSSSDDSEGEGSGGSGSDIKEIGEESDSSAAGSGDEEQEKPKKKKKKAVASSSKKSAGGEPPKKKAKKDPNAPKRAMSSFMFFSNAKRDEVKRDNPSVAFTEVAKILGKMWKEISDEEKKIYEEMADKDKERYQKEMATYTPSSAASSPKSDKGKVKKEKKATSSSNLGKSSELSAEVVVSDSD